MAAARRTAKVFSSAESVRKDGLLVQFLECYTNKRCRPPVYTTTSQLPHNLLKAVFPVVFVRLSTFHDFLPFLTSTYWFSRLIVTYQDLSWLIKTYRDLLRLITTYCVSLRLTAYYDSVCFLFLIPPLFLSLFLLLIHFLLVILFLLMPPPSFFPPSSLVLVWSCSGLGLSWCLLDSNTLWSVASDVLVASSWNTTCVSTGPNN